jgi:hypothetical protein
MTLDRLQMYVRKHRIPAADRQQPKYAITSTSTTGTRHNPNSAAAAPGRPRIEPILLLCYRSNVQVPVTWR